jgi:hypothetical protein
MIFYRGLGYLTFIFFIVPLLLGGSILNWGFGIDVLTVNSWWPLHSLMMLGTVFTFALGWYFNRNMVEDTIYEKTGPVRVLRPRHTLYWIRMEYWGPIILAVYFACIAYGSLR